jgi:hypothetical protein
MHFIELSLRLIFLVKVVLFLICNHYDTKYLDSLSELSVIIKKDYGGYYVQ